MTTRKHTNGEWKYHKGNLYLQHCRQFITAELIVANEHSNQEKWVAAVIKDIMVQGPPSQNNERGEKRIVSEIDIDTQEANGRLIASCPRMYEYIRTKANKGDVDAKQIIKDIDTIPPETQREKRLISRRLNNLLKKIRKEKTEKTCNHPNFC